MIVEAINKILQLDKEIVTKEIDGRLYSLNELTRLPKPEETAPLAINFSTLTGIQDFTQDFKATIEHDLELEVEPLFFHVVSPIRVQLCGSLQPENYNKRYIYANAELDYGAFAFAIPKSPIWHDLELFVIALQSLFVTTTTTENIIDMLGTVANEHVQENKDDGFSQTIQVRTGIAAKEKATIQNPVSLKPWRTFREVDQPESNFILRLRKGPQGLLQCSLWEADGGVWRGQAMANIQKWLEDHSEIPAIA